MLALSLWEWYPGHKSPTGDSNMHPSLRTVALGVLVPDKPSSQRRRNCKGAKGQGIYLPKCQTSKMSNRTNRGLVSHINSNNSALESGVWLDVPKPPAKARKRVWGLLRGKFRTHTSRNIVFWNWGLRVEEQATKSPYCAIITSPFKNFKFYLLIYSCCDEPLQLNLNCIHIQGHFKRLMEATIKS